MKFIYKINFCLIVKNFSGLEKKPFLNALLKETEYTKLK